MELTYIIPEGPKGFLIQNKQFLNYLTKSINYNYSLKGDSVFPAPQPVSIEKKDFSKFTSYKYTVALKLDGTRFLMYFIKDKHNNNYCILINRALQFFTIEMNAENTIYNGTIIDGELIKIDNQWTFMVHDAVLICGNKINKLTHTNRLNDTKMCLESFIANNPANTVNICIKEFYPFEDFTNFIDNVYNKNIDRSDGIIFMPDKLPVISGTQYSMLKWKPPTKHTFDFLVNEIDVGLEAKIFHMGKMNTFAKIHNNTEQGKVFITKTKEFADYKNECIVECTFNKEQQNFEPILIRTDKTHPNSLRTIERTLFNINENINIEDIQNINKQ